MPKKAILVLVLLAVITLGFIWMIHTSEPKPILHTTSDWLRSTIKPQAILQHGMTFAHIVGTALTANCQNAPSMAFTHWAGSEIKHVAQSTAPFQTHSKSAPRLPSNLPLFARHDDFDGGNDFWRMGANLRPPRRRQNQDGNSTAFQVLLIAQVLVGSDKNVEGVAFSRGQ
jgi:hypothetical protein